MADDVKIGSASIDIRVDGSKIESDFKVHKSTIKKSVDEMSAQLSKIKMSVDNSVLKLKFDEAVKWRNDLQTKFEKQIKMNADVSTIQKTKTALDAVNGSLSNIGAGGKARLDIDSSILKMKFQEATRLRDELKAKLEQQIKMNLDVSTIQKTKTALDAVNGSLSNIGAGGKARLDIDSSILKMKFQEATRLRDELKAKLEQQIKMNLDVSTIQETKSKLEEVNTALAGTKQAQDDVVDKASKWGMIATGINQTVQALREFFQQAKQLVGQSVNAAAELQVLRDNFVGSAQDLELFKKATAGTVSEAGLIKLSNQASDLGLSLEQQAIFFSMSEDAADKYGGSVEENFGKVIAASEGSAKGVRGLGIETKAFQQKVDELARAEGGSIEALDAETQKRIRLTALQQLSGVTLDQVTAKQKDNKDLIEAAGIEYDAAKVKLGNFVLSGLTPLLKAFDESNKSIKDFITYTTGLVGILINLVPIIVQVYSAQKIFAGAVTLSAAANTSNAAAIGATGVAAAGATAPVAGFFTAMKAGLASIGPFVAGLAAAAFVINSFNSMDSPKSTLSNKLFDMATGKADLEELKKLQDDKRKALEQGYRINSDGSATYIGKTKAVTEEIKKQGSEVDKLRAKLIWLQESASAPGLTLKELTAINKEIERINSLLSGKTKKEEKSSNYFENYEKDKKELAEVNKLIAEKEKLLKADIKSGKKNQEIEDQIKLNILKAKQLELEEKLFPYTAKPKIEAGEIAVKEESGRTIKDAVSSFVPEKADGTGKHLEDLTAITDEALKADRANAQLANTIASGFAQGIFAGESFSNILGNMANKFGEVVLQALAFKGIMAGLNAFGLGGVLSFLGIGAAAGGSFENGQKIASFAAGGSFIVPTGYPNDSFPIRVQSGERVTVTPSANVGDQSRAINDMARTINRLAEKLNNIQGGSSVGDVYLDGQKVGTHIAKNVTQTQIGYNKSNIKVTR